jgi:hypothetical protein
VYDQDRLRRVVLAGVGGTAMPFSAQHICLWMALLLFVLAAVAPTAPTRIALTPAGLAFLAGALLLGAR